MTGLARDGTNLWLAHNDFPEKARLSLVDTSGEILVSHVSPIIEINGLAWAEGYFWALGSDSIGAESIIYKLVMPAK